MHDGSHSLEKTGTGSKKRGRHDGQRGPSSEMPPPGTIMCTCGRVEPQVCSTAAMRGLWPWIEAEEDWGR